MAASVKPLIFVTAVTLTTWAAAQSTPFDRMLDDRLAGSPDAAIVVGSIDGSATNLVTRGKPGPDANTAFETGGLTEVFVAVVLADMVAKREVTLRDPVAKHLPGVAVPTRAGKSITLEDLAMHRSGLPRVLPGLGRGDLNRYAAYTPQRLAEFLEGYELTRDIGERYERSQLGIALLIAALATRAGMPIENLLRDRVIAPLGLIATRMTAGALQSTLGDLMKFAAANLSQDGPLASVVSDTQASRGPAGVRGESLGLGWRIRTSGPRQILWAGGAAAGHSAFMVVEPAAARAAVVLHDRALSVDDIGFSALEHMGETATPVDAASLQAFAGEYEVKPGLRIHVRVEGRKLAVKVGDEPESTLTQDSELRFVFDYADARITFVRGADGAVIGLMLHRDRQHVAARRIR